MAHIHNQKVTKSRMGSGGVVWEWGGGWAWWWCDGLDDGGMMVACCGGGYGVEWVLQGWDGVGGFGM